MALSQSELKKKSFKGGHMRIQLASGKDSFLPGQIIQGVVYLQLSETCFWTTQMTIGLHGKENTKFLSNSQRAKEEKSIIDVVLPL